MEYKLFVYVPKTHKEELKNALFSAGGGTIGAYDCCCWEVCGTGQFRPLENSNPYVGQRGTIERVEEYRIEMLVASDKIQEVLAALFQAHPYEEPAYDFVSVLQKEDL
ncbi:MAG: NGG1p interacting factor NIF3 [Fibrobacterota bacterium]